MLICACMTSLVGAQTMEGADPIEPFHARQGGAVRLSVSSHANVSGEGRHGPQLTPSVEYHWANGWMLGTDRGVAYNFSRDPGLQYGLGLGADLGRRASDTGALLGMGSIDAKPEVAAFISKEFARDWRITSTFRHGSTNNSHGTVAELGLNHTIHLAPAWRMGLNASAKWANTAYMQSYYGVSSSQSLTSGHAQYTPSSGVNDISAGVNLNHQVTPQISLTTGISASSLRGEARASPVVTKPDSLVGQFSVAYSF